MTSKISNPLTIVAVFSGLAEAFATVALLNLPHDLQSIFLYFVMGFPVLLVILFFLVLNWNHTVLYAPSDFEDQAIFLESIRVRESLRSKVIEALASPEAAKDGVSSDQLNLAVGRVNAAIDHAVPATRSEQILEVLKNGPASSAEICKKLDLHPSYAARLLSNLVNQGMLVRSSGLGSANYSLRRD